MKPRLEVALMGIEEHITDKVYLCVYFSDEYNRYYAELDPYEWDTPAQQVKTSGESAKAAIVALGEKLLRLDDEENKRN